MAFDIFLIADAASDSAASAAALEKALAAAPVSALLIAAGEADDATYGAFVATLAKIAQAHDCAVVLDNRPDMVRQTGADGVHMSGGIKTLKDAIADLKPDFIVGTGDIGSRHEAMMRGELDVDYLMFGDRADGLDDGADMAQWWSETFEVPCVYLASDATTVPGSEFVALRQDDWPKIATLAEAAQ